MDTDFDTMINSIQSKLNKLNLNRGILFITDIYGGTPSNIAQLLATSYDAYLISGVNLPMIIRFLTTVMKQRTGINTKSTGWCPQGRTGQ